MSQLSHSVFPTGNSDYDQMFMALGSQVIRILCVTKSADLASKKLKSLLAPIQKELGHGLDEWMTRQIVNSSVSTRTLRRLFEVGHIAYPNPEDEGEWLGLLSDALTHPQYPHRAQGEAWLGSKGDVKFRVPVKLSKEKVEKSPQALKSDAPPKPVKSRAVVIREGLLDDLRWELESTGRRPDFLRAHGKRHGTGWLLCRYASLDLWQAAFPDASRASQPGFGWSALYPRIESNAITSICRRACGESPSKDWYVKLDWLLGMSPTIALSSNQANPMHLLASANFADLGERMTAMRRIEKIWREKAAAMPPTSHSNSAWRFTDGDGATPFMRAVRAGDPKMAHLILLADPAAARPDRHGFTLEAIVEHCDPSMASGLIECLRKRCPDILMKEQVSKALARVPFVEIKSYRNTWKKCLDGMQENVAPAENTPERAVKILPGRGATTFVLAGAHRRKK